jgi:hypothetical protein
MVRKVGIGRSWRDGARRQRRCCSAGAGEEETEGGRGHRLGGSAGLLGWLGGMGQKTTGPEERKIKIDFNFELISRFRKK